MSELEAIRLHQYSRLTEEAYIGWVRRYVRFSGLRHPAELGSDDVRRFLTDLADTGRVSASTQSQALSSLCFSTGRWWAGSWTPSAWFGRSGRSASRGIGREEVRGQGSRFHHRGGGGPAGQGCEGPDHHAGGLGPAGASGPARAGPAAAPAGPGGGWRVCAAPGRLSPEIAECGAGVVLAVRVPGYEEVSGAGDRALASAPPARVGGAAGGQACGAGRRQCQARIIGTDDKHGSSKQTIERVHFKMKRFGIQAGAFRDS
jgi:hypothetical protein